MRRSSDVRLIQRVAHDVHASPALEVMYDRRRMLLGLRLEQSLASVPGVFPRLDADARRVADQLLCLQRDLDHLQARVMALVHLEKSTEGGVPHFDEDARAELLALPRDLESACRTHRAGLLSNKNDRDRLERDRRAREEAASLLCALAIADEEKETPPYEVPMEVPTRKRSRSDARSIPGGCGCPCGCARDSTPGGPYYDLSTRREICNSCRTTQGRARLFFTRGAAEHLSAEAVGQRKRCTTKPCWTGQLNQLV